jgi:polysaccharide biosynthesis transport protein
MMRRYRSWIVGPTFAGLVIATVVAFLWPDTYISTAVMRITPQQVSDKLVPTMVTSQMADRLQQLQTEILSRTSLAELIQKPSLDLYKRDRNRLPMEDIVQDMKNRYIKITPISDASGARRYSSAFAISFAYIDRYKAQAVVRELVTKFTETNVTVQRNQASLTTNFLNDELKAAKERMDKLDEDIIKFKQANMGRLPEQASSNMQAQQTYSMQLMSLNQSINRAMQDKMLLESDLKLYRNQQNAAAASLTETVAGTTTYAPAAVQQNPRLLQLNSQIQSARADLNAKKQLWGAGHPDIAVIEAAIQSQEKERDDLEKREMAQQPTSAAPITTAAKIQTNPAVQQHLDGLKASEDSTRSRLTAKEMEVQDMNRQRMELEKLIGSYQARLEAAPLNEQQYNAMNREFNLAKQEYEDMVKRHSASETAQSLEEHKAGENLEVLDPATLPEQPSEPNRLAWAGIGTAAGLGLGILLAAAQEVRNTSLKNLKDVRAYTNMPVLSSIPLLENALLVRRKRRLVWLAWSSAVLVGLILMGGAVYYRMSGV